MLSNASLRFGGAMALCVILVANLAAQTIARPTGEPQPVDASVDPVNRIASENSETVLRVTLDIRGSDVTVDSARVTKMRARDYDRRPNANYIVVNAITGNDIVVGRAFRSDQDVNALEGSGTVFRKNRRVSIAVPIIALPKEILVALPREPEPARRLGLPDDVASYCDTFRDDPICSQGSLESHPLFRILNPDLP